MSDCDLLEWYAQVLTASFRNPTQTYISPSDAILSPASQKLSSFKQKQVNKSIGGGRSLFAKHMTAREKDLGALQEGKK